jgi:biopolymer transport protein ExbD
LKRRAERRNRAGAQVDLNLVSLIDVFTILIFFLLANSMDVQTLAAPAGVRLPEALSEQAPRDGIELAVSGHDVLLQGQRVATLDEPAWRRCARRCRRWPRGTRTSRCCCWPTANCPTTGCAR